MKWWTKLFSKEKKIETKKSEPMEPIWFNIAYKFLAEYCKKHDQFLTYQVKEAAELSGLPEPMNNRAWGGVIIVAVNNGLIYNSGKTEKFNSKEAPIWKSLVYKK